MSIFPDIDPNVTSGTQLATILNDFKDCYAQGNADTTRDANLTAGGRWIDTTNDPSWEYKLWTGTIDIILFTIDKNTGNVILPNSEDSFEIIKTGEDSLPAIFNIQKERDNINGQVLDGDNIGQINWTGKTDTGVEEITAQVEVVSSDDFTAAAHGAYMRVLTTTDNTATLVERLRFATNGNIGVNTATADLKVTVLGDGIGAYQAADDDVAPMLKLQKSRLASSGQVLNNDNIGDIPFYSTDQNGDKVQVGLIRVKSLEDHTDTQHGAELIISLVETGTNTLVEKLRITDDETIINGEPQVESTQNISLLHGGVDNPLTTIDSTVYKAAVIELFAEGNDGVEERVMKYKIDCFYSDIDSTWYYEYEEKLFKNEALMDLVFTNAATLTIEYSNNLVQGSFVGGDIRMKIRRWSA